MYTEITTWDEVCRKNGDDPKKLPDVSTFPKEDRKYIMGCHFISRINKAINGDFVPDYANRTQKKWSCIFWWDVKLSAFVFADTHFGWADADTTGGSRLDFETEEQAVHFGKYFLPQINDFLKK